MGSRKKSYILETIHGKLNQVTKGLIWKCKYLLIRFSINTVHVHIEGVMRGKVMATRRRRRRVRRNTEGAEGVIFMH